MPVIDAQGAVHGAIDDIFGEFDKDVFSCF